MRTRIGLACLLLLLGASPAWGQCGVFKVYGLREVLLSTDLNASFTRTVAANTAACATGYSASVTQMKVTADPYPSSTESLASTMADELARLRFQVNAIVGKSFWYQPVDISLAKSTPKHFGATYLQASEIADPVTPGPNDARLYFKDDGGGVTVLAYKDAAGTVNTLTGASTSYGSSVTVNYQARRNPGTPDTKLDLSADRISVKGFIKASFAVTIDATTTGANALDTGVLQNNFLYYVWVIYNPATATFAGLASANETAPTMPTGYTQKRLMGAFKADGAAKFEDGVQKGAEFTYTTPSASITFATGGPTSLSFCSAIPNHVARAARFYLLDSNIFGGGLRATMIHWQTFTANTVTPAGTPLSVNTPFARVYEAMWTLASVRIPLLNATDTCHIYVQQVLDQVSISVAGWEIEWKD